MRALWVVAIGLAALAFLTVALEVGSSSAGSPPRADRAAHSDAAPIGPTSRPAVTDGGYLDDFEALLHQEFPARPPCVSPQFHYVFRSELPGGRCAKDSEQYHYLFRNSRRSHSTFHLMGFGLSHLTGGNCCAVAKIKGRLVSCHQKQNAALGLLDTNGIADSPNPPTVTCAFYAATTATPFPRPVRLPARYKRAELTAQGRTVWNLEALLRELHRHDRYICSLFSDPRTPWDIVVDDFNCNDYQYEFDKSHRRSAFHLGPFYGQNERVSNANRDVPVLANGRVIVCQSRPLKYLFGNRLWRIQQGWIEGWFQPVCNRPRVSGGDAPGLLVDVSGRGRGRMYIPAWVSVVGWRYACGVTKGDRRDTFTLSARSDGSGVGRYRAVGQRGEGQLTPFANTVQVTVLPRPAAGSPQDCHWSIWAYAARLGD